MWWTWWCAVRWLGRTHALPRLALGEARVLVTGGGGGVGGHLVAEFAARGVAAVVVVDVDGERVARVVEAVGARHPAVRVEGVVMDVTSAEARRGLVAELAEKGLAINVLVNNAGVVAGRRVGSGDGRAEAMVTSLRVNVEAPMALVEALWPQLAGSGEQAQIVNVASTMGLVPAAGLADYCCSKYGLVGFHESLALEVRADGRDGYLGLTLVCPYKINTGMFDGVQLRMPWLLPALEADDVARSIVESVEAREEVVVLPWAVGAMFPVLGLLPRRVWVAVVEWFGGRHGMDNFAPRPDRELPAALRAS
ncbi:uncharacterized protein AMSG_11369 [Thecamonas trahens ATCC 50062]|uniref:Uncharacterized protein n=1 Tax=Thecamonas trahens ATCC 50062 TaxID=461836 RepID=A0A0L0DWJ7_THETB|nr:hypothetical protein AMSG_11369 [Thecamonas trahens ATCC 50062]KNC55903.1 hypothetical protein AMSG_11369 [Thecamonas trahens ATCC 50062]|eukprot:XP_013752722.1 hypothetical protein AMSG_11369 [Thecamonas trahens ATCC 50062]